MSGKFSYTTSRDLTAGYRFCGWKNFQTGPWQMHWTDDLQGALLRLFARHMRCSTARRKMRALDRQARRYPRQDPTRLPGYRAQVLRERHEYRDVRYVLKSNPRVTFRFQTGS